MTALVDTRKEFGDLAGLYLPIAGGVFVLVVGALVIALLRARRREGDPDAGMHDATRAEGIYAVVLAGVAAALLAVTFSAESKVDPVAGRPGLVVVVTASQWSWRFDYPRYGVSVLGPYQHPATLVVPTGTTVRFRMTSQDVIHSFWVPGLRFKRDAFPDRTTRFDMVFAKPGTHRGECAEFCGLNHADMSFTVRALPPGRFAAWATRQRVTR